MKKIINKQILSILCLAAMFLPVHAADWLWMEVVMNNQEETTRLQLQDTPTIIFEDDYAIVQADGYVVENLLISEIQKIHYLTENVDSSVEEMQCDMNVLFDGDCIKVSGLESNPEVGVFDLVGIPADARVEYSETGAVIYLGSLSRDVYVVRINNKSFKVRKK